MNEFMKKADELARKNLLTNDGGPFGAVVVKDGVIVGEGNNHVLANNDPTAHAEIMAIRNACERLHTFDLSGCELYVNCQPCPMCLSAIIWSNIKKVYFGNTKEDAANIGFRDDMIYKYLENFQMKNVDNSILDIVPMDRDDTIEAFDLFLNKPDKKMY